MQWIIELVGKFMEQPLTKWQLAVVIAIVGGVILLVKWRKSRRRSLKQHAGAWLTSFVVPALNRLGYLRHRVVGHTFGWTPFSSMSEQLDVVVPPRSLEENWRVDDFLNQNRRANDKLIQYLKVAKRLSVALDEMDHAVKSSPTARTVIATCISGHNAQSGNLTLSADQAEKEIRMRIINGMNLPPEGSIYDSFWNTYGPAIAALRNHQDVMQSYSKVCKLRMEFLNAANSLCSELETIARKLRAVAGPIPDQPQSVKEEEESYFGEPSVW